MNLKNTPYHAFNGLKALVHVEYWKQIIDKKIVPPPRFVSIDPCAVCNFNCCFCNAKKVIDNKKMSPETMKKIVKTLKSWKTLACCLGGGGESLLNPVTLDLIDELYKLNIELGIVTNGSVLLDKKHLSKCRWVGVSVDAANAITHSKIKGVSTNCFYKVINDLYEMTNKGAEISYKFLIHPDNYLEIYEATKLAKKIGCNLIHIRPGAEPWFKKDKSWHFNNEMVLAIREEIKKARELEDNNFKVYGITEKFNPDFSVRKSFKECYACFTTCFINYVGDVGLCCDRRGDKKIILCNIKDANKYWGSKKHFKIHENIDIIKCPRCTYSHVNEIFENVIIEDRMGYNLY
jgi:Predicted Fe-S oxidoreductases